MPRHTELELNSVVRTQDGIFLFKEPIVLLTVICLTVSNAITTAVQDLWIKDNFISGVLSLYSLSATAAPMIGILLFGFLSEVYGRKPIFITLFTLSILSDVLHSLPWTGIIYIAFPVQGLLRGASRAMNLLAITEYCTPKHRLTYMLVNSAALVTAAWLTTMMFTFKPTSYIYVLSFQIVLALVCLVSVRNWPESPYWLASKGKLEESGQAFSWLRGEEGRKERDCLLKERRSPGPLNLYWTSFFVAIATMSVTVFTDIGGRFIQRWVVFHDHVEKFISPEYKDIIRPCSYIVSVSLIAVVSYFVKRKVLFLLVSGFSILFSYAVAIWIHVDPTIDDPNNRLFYFVFITSDMVSKYGPQTLGVFLSIEIMPLKYNTHMVCIGLILIYVVYFPFMTFFWRSDFESSHAFIPVFTTLSLVGVVAYGCLAPETKDKTLLEIQELYTPELRKENPKEEHVVMTHI